MIWYMRHVWFTNASKSLQGAKDAYSSWASDQATAVTLGTCAGTDDEGQPCPRTNTDKAPCPTGCTSTTFVSPWDIVGLRPPSQEAKDNDPVLPADHAYAGEDFSTLKTIKRTKGAGVDPFCYDHHNKNYVFFMDLGFFSFPKQSQLCKLERLKQEKWLDWRTKQVTIGTILYNANLDMYTRITVKFDLTIGGRISKWVDVHSHQIRHMYSTPGDAFRAVMEFVFLALLAKQWYDLVQEYRSKGRTAFFANSANLLNLMGQLMYFVNIIVWMMLCARTARWMLPEMSDYIEAYSGILYVIEEFDSVHNLFSLYKVFNTISILINIIRLFINMQFHERMGLVTKTIVYVWEDLCTVTNTNWYCILRVPPILCTKRMLPTAFFTWLILNTHTMRCTCITFAGIVSSQPRVLPSLFTLRSICPSCYLSPRLTLRPQITLPFSSSSPCSCSHSWAGTSSARTPTASATLPGPSIPSCLWPRGTAPTSPRCSGDGNHFSASYVYLHASQ